MHWILALGVASTAIASSVAAVAQAPAPADTIRLRQGQYREIGTAFKAINDELKKPAPGKFLMGSSARTIAGNLKQVVRMFPAGSGPSSGVKTKALPAIWTRQAEFVRLNAAAVVEADKLALVLKGADTAAMAAQAKALGGTCQACHKQFRAED